ncbi:MAG TPA: hypothetical protein VGC54_07005 [Planctomycetota bacterium]
MRSRGARVSILLCLLLAGSGWLPLPVPLGGALERLGHWELGGRELTLTAASARLRWARGRLEARGIVLALDGKPVVEAAAAVARVGLVPFTRGFLQPGGLDVHAPVFQGDPELADWVRVLLESEPAGGTPELPLRLLDAHLVWEGAEGAKREFFVPEISGRLGSRLSLVHGLAHDAFGHRAELWLTGEHDFSVWRLDLIASAAPLRIDKVFELPMLEHDAESLALRATVTGGKGRLLQVALDGSLSGAALSLGDPALKVVDAELRLAGSLARGMRLDAVGVAETVPFRAVGRLMREGDAGPVLRLEADFDPIVVDEHWVARAEQLDAGTARALDAIETRGPLRGRLGLVWDGVGAPEWIAHGRLEGLRSVYRGFLEADGTRPSFPYPIEDLRGDLVAAGNRMLIGANGRMGEASFVSRTMLELGGGHAGIATDVRVEGLAIDTRITSAAVGTAGFAEIWRDLGNPQGGAVDLDLHLRRPHRAERVGIQLDARGTGTVFRPTFLPVGSVADDYHVRWLPGKADFGGTLRGLGGLLRVDGGVRRIRDEDLSSIHVLARGRQLRPEAGDLRVLERFLDLPRDFAAHVPAAAIDVEVGFRRAGGAPEPTVLMNFVAGPGDWTHPGSGLVLAARSAAGMVAVAGERTTVAVPRARAQLAGGTARGSFMARRDEAAGPATITAEFQDLEVDGRLLAAFREATGADLGQRFLLGGRVHAAATLNPLDAGARYASVDLAPLTAFDTDSGEDVRVEGRLDWDDATLSARRLTVGAGGNQIELSDFELRGFESDAGSGREIRVVLDSEGGLQIDERFAALVDPGAWAAFQRIGLQGRVGARGLRVRIREIEAAVSFDADGELTLSEMRVEGPPVMRNGYGVLQIDRFSWRGTEDYEADMRLREGRVRVSGLAVHEARGQLRVDPKEIAFSGFQAATLGGTLRTWGERAPGIEEQGYLRLGLTPQAPLAVLLYLEDLSLARVRDELRLGGSLAGRIDGRIAFTSDSPSPLDYTGRGRIEVRDGVLGTVPVLSQLWKAVGVQPPNFHSGTLEWVANAENNRGTVHVSSFVLDHELLEVRGSGWIDLDGYLRMKATVRTFSVLGRLPLVKDLIDLLVERNAFGPFERPVITSRTKDKLTSGDEVRHPFPLWTPEVAKPEWTTSPALPALPPPARDDELP